MKSKKSVFAAMGLVFFITVPWLFTEASETDWLGFPPWAAWTVVSTIGASFFVAFCLGRYWDVSGYGTKTNGGKGERPVPRRDE